MVDILVVPPEPEGDERIAYFRDEGKLPWDERFARIKKAFPAVDRLNWQEVFRQDTALLGRLVNDILKVDAALPGKPGKRPAVDPKDASERLRQITGEDFTCLPFPEAFKVLCGDRSIRHIATKTGLERTYVHRIQREGVVPTAKIMTQIAFAFDKEPGYFVEYRLAYILSVLHERMSISAESTVGFYRKLQSL